VAETRKVIYRGPADGGLRIGDQVLYPGDEASLDDRLIGSLMRTGGHRFQNVGGDIVRPYELSTGKGESTATEAPPTAPPADPEREARLREAQEIAHKDDAASTLVENQQAAEDAAGKKPKK
jgi:hypothetical protein